MEGMKRPQGFVGGQIIVAANWKPPHNETALETPQVSQERNLPIAQRWNTTFI